MSPPPLNRDGFHFAIVCALPIEFDAVYFLLDEIWEKSYGTADGDQNRYHTGCIGELPIVLVLLPGMGKVEAASSAASLRISYKNVNTAFVVGICGAVPYYTNRTEVILGDVIISKYVVQYDLGRQHPDEFIPKRTTGDILGRPNKAMRSLNAALQTHCDSDKLEHASQSFLQQLQEKVMHTKNEGNYDYVGIEHDQLFRPDYRHKHYRKNDCHRCNACTVDTDPVCEMAPELECVALGCNANADNLVARVRLQSWPSTEANRSKIPAHAIYVGGIGSADTVMKSAKCRDRISKRDEVIGFEMEGAGVWDEVPSCLIIKGVCDYADSHKSKRWQNYAAATAACTAKALLLNFFQDEQKKSQITSSLFFVPFSQNEDFIGRRGAIEKIMTQLYARENARIALFGMGGSGKTQLALETAHLLRGQSPEKTILWLPVFSMASFGRACKDLVGKLLPHSQDGDARKLLQQHLSSEGAGSWLIILDNADSEAVLYDSKDTLGIYSYLPQHQRGQILLTTRWRKIAIEFAKRNVVSVAEMKIHEARELLGQSLGSEYAAENNHVVDELLQELTYLPLAIIQATTYIRIFGVSLTEYLRLCRHSRQDMMELMRNQYKDETLYSESQGAVATTWLISFDEIRKQSPKGAELLFFLMCIEPHAIPLSILPKTGSEQDHAKAIGTLKSFGFLQNRNEEGLLDLHSLVHMVIQFWAKEKSIDTQSQLKALRHLTSVFQSDKWEERETWSLQLPHVLHALRACQNFDIESAYMLAEWAGRCLIQEVRPKEAVALLAGLEENKQLTLKQDNLNRLAVQHMLAIAYQSDNQLDKAFTLLKNVITIKKSILTEENPELLASLHQLATVYQLIGEHDEAIVLLEPIVKIEERTLHQTDLTRLSSQQALASSYCRVGRFKDGIPRLEHVVEMKKTLVDADPSRLVAQELLADAYFTIGQTAKGYAMMQNIVEIKKGAFPHDHPFRLDSEELLADMHHFLEHSTPER